MSLDVFFGLLTNFSLMWTHPTSILNFRMIQRYFIAEENSEEVKRWSLPAFFGQQKIIGTLSGGSWDWQGGLNFHLILLLLRYNSLSITPWEKLSRSRDAPECRLTRIYDGEKCLVTTCPPLRYQLRLQIKFSIWRFLLIHDTVCDMRNKERVKRVRLWLLKYETIV